MKKLFNKFSVMFALCAMSAGSLLAQTADPMGVLESFDPSTAGTAIKGLIILIIGVVGCVYGAKLGLVVLDFLYNKVAGSLKKSK